MKCALPICKERGQGFTTDYGDLCAKHAKEAKAFYDAEAKDLPLIPPTDTGSDEKGTILAKDAKAASELKVEAKQDFAQRATLTKVKNLETLKLSAPAVKDALRESFTSWLTKGIPLSKEDPITLTVELVNFRGEHIISSHKSTDLSAALHETQVERINSLLYDLPALLEEVFTRAQELKNDAVNYKRKKSARVQARSYRITLGWWGTIKQMSYEEFLKSPVKAVFYDKSVPGRMTPIN